MHPVLVAVSIAHDAIEEHQLHKAFTILGPDGEAACEFELRAPRVTKVPFERWSVVDKWKRIREHLEGDYDSVDISDEEVDDYIQYLKRSTRAYLEKMSEWRNPPPASRISNWDAALKEYYTDAKLKDMASKPSAFLSILKKETDSTIERYQVQYAKMQWGD